MLRNRSDQNRGFSPLFCHEMRLVDMFGRAHRLSFVQIWTLLSNWRAIGLVCLVAVAIFGTNPHGYRGHMPLLYEVLIWQFGAGLLILLKLLAFACLSKLTFKRPTRRIYLPLLSSAEFTIVFLAMLWVQGRLVDDTYQFDHLAAFPFLLVTLLIVEVLFMRFLLSTYGIAGLQEETDAANGQQAPAPLSNPPTGPRLIEIGDRRIRVDNLRYIASEEHYLRVVTKQETIVQRAKLGDVIDQLHDSDGVRPHRSWWVCRHACPRLTRDGARGTIHLPDFDLSDLPTIPVARSRLQQVQDWFDFHMDW